MKKQTDREGTYRSGPAYLPEPPNRTGPYYPSAFAHDYDTHRSPDAVYIYKET